MTVGELIDNLKKLDSSKKIIAYKNYSAKKDCSVGDILRITENSDFGVYVLVTDFGTEK